MGNRERASRGWLSFAVNIVTSTGCYAAAYRVSGGGGGTSAPIASTYSVPTVVREKREGESARAREHTATVCGRGDGGAKVAVREGKARFARKRLVVRREFRLKIVRVVVVGFYRRGCSVCRVA